jgi:tetratricopeptide (TPR) repeat protein
LAINKRKILESAQKHLQKGALDKALKDYETLLEADPKDANVRLKLGDLQLKQGKTDEAIAAYLKVAERFMSDGFDSKAIALYKQVSKIDPKRYDIYLPLSELYQRLGLRSDAMKALQTAADVHYREGDKNQALDLLRKMATLDPSNTTNRLKVAELLRQEGRAKEALAEYEEVAAELDRQGDGEGRVKVLRRILDLAPDRMETEVALGTALVAQRKWSQAGTVAEAMIEAFPAEPDGYELLAEICRQSGREGDLPGVYRRLAEVYKERGDEDHAREIMQRFVSTGALGSQANGDSIREVDDELAIDAAVDGEGTLGMAPEELPDPGSLPDQHLRPAEPIGGVDRRDPSRRPDPREMSASSLPPLPPLEIESRAEEEPPEGEGDAEQLLAEASVYLRYGKHERAIEGLRTILSRSPGHRAALEKLGEALLASGDAGNAITAFVRAAKGAQAEGDAAGFESVRAKVEALDPAAAESLSPATEARRARGETRRQEAAAQPGDIEIEIDSGIEAASEGEILDSEDSIEFEIEGEVETGRIPGAEGEPGAAVAPAGEPIRDAEEIERDFGDGAPSFESGEEEGGEDDIEVPGLEGFADAVLERSLEDTVARGTLPPLPSGGSSTTPQQMIEDLEEADFYFQQGLYDEAEEVYRRVLDAAPNHPQAMLRIGEIEAARSGGEEAAFEGHPDPAIAPRPARESERMAMEAPEPEHLAPALEAREAEPAPRRAEPEEGEEGDFGIELPGSASLSRFDEAREFDFDIDPPAESAPAEMPARRGSRAPQADATVRLMSETTGPVDPDAGEAACGGDFDLAAELMGAFAGEESGRFSESRGGTTEAEGFEQVFAAFKLGVQQELGDGDIEAHYDLGIAYKEMGLLEDAIGEFRIALGGPSRQLASLHAMGLCAIDLHRGSDAISHLEQALALPDLPVEQQAALRFDLGRAYEQQGDLGRAREAFEAVAAVDPDFGAVGERLAELERRGGGGGDALAAEPAEETFESFDEFIADVAPDLGAERYESFEDLLSERDDDEEGRSGDSEATLGDSDPEALEPAAELAPVPEPEDAPIELEPEATPIELLPAPEPEPEASPIELPPAPEPEPEAAPIELSPEPEAAPIQSEPVAEREPERAPAAKKPSRRKKISFV